MELYPALDIHAGKVVRASRTDLARARPYPLDDPFAVSESFAAAGARWVHVVDLDRAFGVGDQTWLVAELVRRLPIAVQVGGGLWTRRAAEQMRDCGARRILLAARAADEPAALEAMAQALGAEFLGLAIDVEQGRVWARGWEGAAGYLPAELARRAGAAGVRLMALTDLSREGKLTGSAWQGAAALAREAEVEVLVSGGVDGLEDLARIRDAGLAGAIVGRALHEARFTVEEALACCSSRS